MWHTVGSRYKSSVAVAQMRWTGSFLVTDYASWVNGYISEECSAAHSLQLRRVESLRLWLRLFQVGSVLTYQPAMRAISCAVSPLAITADENFCRKIFWVWGGFKFIDVMVYGLLVLKTEGQKLILKASCSLLERGRFGSLHLWWDGSLSMPSANCASFGRRFCTSYQNLVVGLITFLN